MSAEAASLDQLSPSGSMARVVAVAALGCLVALSLFTLMRAMVYREAPDFDEAEERRIADIHLAERLIEAVIEDELPDKPEPDEPPPALPQPQPQRDNELRRGAINLSVDLKPQNIHIGPMMAGGEYLPLVKISPTYPRRAQSRGIEGQCTVEYTVTALGAVESPKIVDCSSPLFQNTSLKAALKFKYKPRVVDGQPIAVHGVQNRFIYELED